MTGWPTQGRCHCQPHCMQDHPVLGQVALGFSPMIDQKRAVLATRLTVFPDKHDQVPEAAALLRAIEEVWPADTGEGGGALPSLKLNLRPLGQGAAAERGPNARPLLSLNVAGEGLLQAVLEATPGPHLMIEVPAFMVTDPAQAPALRALHAAGSVLLIKGRPLVPIAPDVLACFVHSIVDAADERRGTTAPPPGVRKVTTVQTGVHTVAGMDLAFQRGAIAVLGWQFEDDLPSAKGRNNIPPDARVVIELIQAVDREEPVHKLEAILKRDPTLGFRLMRYLNAPAFGLGVEINSFGHALMLIGYQKLKRWLALLLASSSKDVNAKATIYAAVRRGLMMEELGKAGGDRERASEMFICGVFSLLDRLLQQSFDDLLPSLPLPERVLQALRGDGGPYQPYLDLVRAIEQESMLEIRECRERLFLGLAEVNRALLMALRAARQLD
jgi:c-di-GMP phosphodiesterase